MKPKSRRSAHARLARVAPTFAAILFCLAACSHEGAVQPLDAGPDALVPSGIDIDGHVVDTLGDDISFALVAIDGRVATTNATGHFHLEDVATPYSPLVIRSGQNGGNLFVGLVSPSPTLTIPAGAPIADVSISGTATGVPFPAPVGSDTVVGVTTPYSSRLGSLSTAAFSNVVASWSGPTTTTAKLIALRVLRGIGNLPTGYDGFATAEVSVSTSAATPAVVLAMSNPAEATLAGTVLPPAGTTSGSVFAFADASGAAVQTANANTTGAFSFTMPSGAGLMAGLTAKVYTADGEGARFVRGLAPNASGLEIEVPAAPHLVSPALGAGGIAPGTTFEWVWNAASPMYVVNFSLAAGIDEAPLSIVTITTEPRFTVPDLSFLGLEWVAGASVHLAVIGFSVGTTTPEQAAMFDWARLIGIVRGHDAMSDIDGAYGLDSSGWTFTSAP